MHRLTRGMVVAGLVAFGAAIALQQWARPSDSWQCATASNCVSAVELDLALLGAEGSVGWQSFDLSPDGTEVVLALATSDDSGQGDHDIAVLSTAGEVTTFDLG